MAQGFDPYAVLGVSRDATADQITHARRQLSRQYHPDVNPAPDAAARFDEVQRAFHLLSDPAAYHPDGGHPGTPRASSGGTGKPGLVAQPAAVDFGPLGPGRPAADATVTVTWAGARPRRVVSDPGGDWWATVGSAVSAASGVAVFHLRARAPAGAPDGRRQALFTATLDDTSVVIPLTAEFSSAVPPTVPDASWRPPRVPWVNWLLVAVFIVIVIVTLTIH